jgi:hypothetical protein
LHVLNEPGATIEHFEFLGRSSQENPMLELLENLKNQIGAVGNIVVWYKSFESSRNTEMGKLYPEYAEFLADVNSRIFNLMDIFKDQLFVHPDFHGSNSIKHILPVLAPELSYKELDVQNGEMAAARWYEAVSAKVDDEKANQTFESLLTYCGLDTFAMVRIYQYLKNL